MAKGKDKHAAHQAAVAALGKNLSRRAKNRCELCEQSTSLKVIEVAPTFDEPHEERAILICARCAAIVAGEPSGDDNSLRFLESVVWSETLPVQICAVRILKALRHQGVDWARECLDGIFLDEEVEHLI